LGGLAFAISQSWSRATLIGLAADICKIDRALAAVIVDDVQHRR
jgi:hypothetical protein